MAADEMTIRADFAFAHLKSLFNNNNNNNKYIYIYLRESFAVKFYVN